MRYYTYDIIVKNEDVPENQMTQEEKDLGYIPTKLEREVNRIYSEPNEEVVNMNITPIMSVDDVIPIGYHIIYVTKEK